MSHVATIEVHITDLTALERACKRLGLELVRDQKKFKWYGTHVGDYPVPAGFTPADMGKCDHAVRIPGDSAAYEIGVVARRDGKPGYTLMYDFYSGGRGMNAMVGGNTAPKLVQGYAVEKARGEAAKRGFRLQESQRADGSIVVRCSR